MSGQRVTATGKVQRRFESAAIDPSRSRGLSPDNPALIEGRTIFPSTVIGARESPRFLVSGASNPKLGKAVVKGPRAGWPIYHLTLEERATCPRSCHAWSQCYGNSMPYARRHRADGEFLELLRAEVLTVARQHPDGLLIRLHTLGDFFSLEYVRLWRDLLLRLPQLHVFGYTARRIDADGSESRAIAALIWRLADRHWDRFAIRFSRTEPQPGASIIVEADPGLPDVIVCPAQTHKTEACASCGLCWAEAARDKTIAFLRHGMKSHKGIAHGARQHHRRGPQRTPTRASLALDAVRAALPSLFERFPAGARSADILATTKLSYGDATFAVAKLAHAGEARWVYGRSQRGGKVLLAPGVAENAPPVLTPKQARAFEHMRAHAVDSVYSGGYRAIEIAAGCAYGSAVYLTDSLVKKGYIECLRRSPGRRAADTSRFRILGEFRQDLTENAGDARILPEVPAQPNKAEPRPRGLAATWRSGGVANRQTSGRREGIDLAPVTAFRRNAIDRREPANVVTRQLMGDPPPGRLMAAEMSAKDIAKHNAPILAKLSPNAKAELAAFEAAT